MSNKNVQVKICGIRTLRAARVAVESGADYIGFIFVPSSKRYITPQKAKAIIKKLKGSVKTVGIFQDERIEKVCTIALSLKLDFIQLHGNETPEYCKEIPGNVIKAFRLASDFEISHAVKHMKQYNAKYFLLDRQKQGTGDVLSFRKARTLAQYHKLFFAGGLTPENVLEVVEIVKPYGVDVVSGIETNGKEDLEKIRMFIENVLRSRISLRETKGKAI